MLRLACFIVLVTTIASSAQLTDPRHLSTVLDGSGTMATGGTYTNWSAAGQPGGISVSSGGDYTNYAGFLQSVSIKRPGLDTDGDGVIDELDMDNDGDGLYDATEVEGSEFSPTTATFVNDPDSDDDGVPDGDEAVAETDPHDADAHLLVTAIQEAGSDKDIVWIARSNKTYRVLAWDNEVPAEDAYSAATVLGTETPTSPATGTWDVTSGLYTDGSGVTNVRIYAIEPVP